MRALGSGTGLRADDRHRAKKAGVCRRQVRMSTIIEGDLITIIDAPFQA
jgi:hypothetical protein